MKALTRHIYLSLEPTLTTGRMMPMRDLERSVGVKERGLQGQDGMPGPLDEAIEEIFVETGLVLVTRNGPGGGAKLTKDAAEVRRATARLAEQLNSGRARVQRWERILREMMSGQREIPV